MSFSLLAPVAWLLLKRIPQRFHAIFLNVSAILCFTGCYCLSTLNLNSNIARWKSYQVLVGTGAGLGASVLVTFLVRVSPSYDRYSVCEYLYHRR
jgi:hypothetical protein